MKKATPAVRAASANKAARPASQPASKLSWIAEQLHWPSPETTEWFCLRAAFWWVLMLTPALHLFASNRSFTGLAAHGSEGHWQLAMGAALVGQIFAVLRGNLWMRVVALFAFGTLWASIAGLFWASAPHPWGIPLSTGIGLYAALSLDCMVVAIFLARLIYIEILSTKARALDVVDLCAEANLRPELNLRPEISLRPEQTLSPDDTREG